MELHIDFETYSRIDLKKRGLDVYANDDSTGVHCMAWAFDDREPQLWKAGEPLPIEIVNHVKNGGTIVAHNAAFEFAIWTNVCVPRLRWPAIRLEQMRCTMAQAYAMALPGALEKLAPALGIDTIKDMRGKRVMLKLAGVKNDGTAYSPVDFPEQFEMLYEYCKQDVRVEQACDARLLKLSGTEQAVWVADQKINNRGIPIDITTVIKLSLVVEAERSRLDAKIRDLTDGKVQTASSVKALGEWLASQGIETAGIGKADLHELLSDELPDHVRAVLLVRKEAAKSSTAKLDAMLSAAGVDGRVRGAMQYHGASTGRWAGRKVQFQNMPRPRVHSTDDERQEAAVAEIVQLLAAERYDEVDMLYGPITEAIADALRGMVKATKGKRLLAADYSAIEARVLPWLAGQEDVLDIFRSGKDIYLHAASGIYKRKITKKDKAERQIGKVAILALGYQGGVGAFQNMARAYNVKVTDKEADTIKKMWREANPEVVRYWKDLETAAINAVKYPGEKFFAGDEDREVCYRKVGSFLFCRLPSGRVLSYPYPTLKQEETPWGSVVDKLYFKAVDSVTNKWADVSTYGGSLCENVTQAVARDLLASALLALETKGYPVIFHVHDEIVCELDEGVGSVEELVSIMCDAPSWAKGLPVAAEGYEDPRYRK